MLRLRCVAQRYDWGIKGQASTVGRLYALSSGDSISPDTPFAELWMGTHPSGPSEVILEDSSNGALKLKDWIQNNPQALGERVLAVWNGELPLLFKVLSVAKALSIQSHPDKALAEVLHREQPKNYKDDNHKPEMALAVTEFEALCSFVTQEELAQNHEKVAELRAIVGEATLQAVSASRNAEPSVAKGLLKQAFTALMRCEKSIVTEKLAAHVARLNAEKLVRTLSPVEELVLRLNDQYPGDVGVFCPYFLNYLKLKPGEAIYLAANEPHAYLSGECIECMAASDNVVRAGLTPKYRDTDTLCSMLTYKQGLPEVLKGTFVDKYTTAYTPPFDEFEVDKILIPTGETYRLSPLPGPSIFVLFKGSSAVTVEVQGEKKTKGLKTGDIYFIPAGTTAEISAAVDVPATELQFAEFYRARVHSKVFSALG